MPRGKIHNYLVSVMFNKAFTFFWNSPHTRREHPAKSNAGSMRNLPQYSNSVRVRKSNAYLPVPSHTRAASTPSQIEHISKGSSLSPMPISVSAKDLNKVISAGEKHQMKRASSEAPISKPAHNKRSQSISTDSKSQHLHQHHQQQHHHHHHGGKRSPEGHRAASGNSNSNKSNVAPTAALLAELLKGSSENMLSEQRQKTIAVSYIDGISPYMYILDI